MSASERVVRRTAPPSGRDLVRGVSMGDLLASCAAARAVSTPPRHHQPVPRPAIPRDHEPREGEAGPRNA